MILRKHAIALIGSGASRFVALDQILRLVLSIRDLRQVGGEKRGIDDEQEGRRRARRTAVTRPAGALDS